jgi:D-alanine-D-alanine ligase
MSRIDGFVTEDNQIIIIDPNSLSGMDPASFLFREAAEINMSHSRVINHLIETELKSYHMDTSHLLPTHATPINSPQIRVAVLMGGDSNEKEISLTSGRNITYKLSPHKYQAIPLFVTDSMELYQINQSLLVRNSTKEIQSLVTLENKINWSDLPSIADFVFIGLHGGKGENGTVQGALEMLGMPYNGSSVLASSLCMDKYKTAQFLQAQGFDVPCELLITYDQWMADKDSTIAMIKQTIQYPLIVKPSDDGCSVMVEKITTQDQLITAIETLFLNNKKTALIEEFIAGMELTVGVIGNTSPQALPPSQTVVQKDILSIEEKFLPGAGENQTPAPLPSAALVLVQKVMTSVYSAIGCKGYVRIDCFYQSEQESPTGKERVIILEINTLPGLTPATCIFHQAAEVGIRPMDFIDTIIELGFENHRTTQQYQALQDSMSY